MLGVAYKADIDDMRESPAIKITELLLEKDAEVVYHDPYVPDVQRRRARRCASVELTAEMLAAADAVARRHRPQRTSTTTLVAEHAPLMLDTRNALKAFDGDKVVRL